MKQIEDGKEERDRWIERLSEEEYQNLTPKIRSTLLKFQRLSSTIQRQKKSLDKKLKVISDLKEEIRKNRSKENQYFSIIEKQFNDRYTSFSVTNRMKNEHGPYWSLSIKVRGLVTKSIELGLKTKLIKNLSDLGETRHTKMTDEELKDLLRKVLDDRIQEEVRMDIYKFWETKYSLKDLYVNVQ